ncbi:MAG: xylulokinase [Candidatus Velthaea sp.]|jgi:xylulokinase
MYLGLDIGTTATKAVLTDEQHTIVASATATYALHQPGSGISEIDPALWIDAIRSVVHRLHTTAPSRLAVVRAIGLSGQMHSLVTLDADGKAIRPAILWNDERGDREARTLSQTMPGIGELTGVLPMASFTAAKLLWLKNTCPDDFARTAHVVWVKDYIRFWLTGEFATDMSDAAGAQLLDEKNRCWAQPVVDTIGLDERTLPRLVEGTQPTGKLLDRVAAELGLPPGTPIAAGGGDAATGALGLGCVDAGNSFISLGTGAVFVEIQDTYVPRPETLLHTFAHCIPKRWYQMAAMLNGASCLAWVARLCREPDLDTLLKRVESRGDQPGRLLFAPYLRGERTPHNDVHARGAFVGLDAACDDTDLTKAVLEGVAFSLRQGQDLLVGDAKPSNPIGMIGGGARSVYWSKLIATVLDRPLTIFRSADMAAAVGAAMLARISIGGADPYAAHSWPVARVVEPDPQHVAAYAERYAAFLPLYAALAPFAYPRRLSEHS